MLLGTARRGPRPNSARLQGAGRPNVPRRPLARRGRARPPLADLAVRRQTDAVDEGMAFDAVGKLHVAYETKQVSDRFTKREFVVEIADGKYPQFVSFQLTGDRCSLLDGHNVGDMLRVTFNLRGREWRSPQGETKYFNSLDVWKLEAARAGAGADNRGGGGGGRSARADFEDAPAGFRSDEPRPSDLSGRSDDDLPF